MVEELLTIIKNIFAHNSWDFNTLTSILLAIFILYLGKTISAKINFLNRLNLPDPVVGGVLFSIFTLLVHLFFNIKMNFDTTAGDYLMLVFFATVGLNANLRLLKRGGKGLVIFLGICFVFLLFQNFIGVGLASVFNLDPRIGLLAGSVTLTGGHGTGKVYGDMFASSSTPLTGAVEMAMACATFGLILGGIVGTPVSKFLITKFNLSPTALETTDSVEMKFHSRRYDDKESVCTDTMLKSILLITICIIFGGPIVDLLNGEDFILPGFVGCLFTGIILCNILTIKSKEHIHAETLAVIGNVSLAIFLAMAMMKIRLWELAPLAGSLSIIMLVQTLFVVIFAATVSFFIMGRDYDSAIISGGLCGFGLGSTPTAIANMDSIVKHFGPAPRAFLIVPLVGAFSLDIINAVVIQCYMALPWFSDLIK